METAHIYIYGEVIYEQDKNADEWGYVNLSTVKKQYDAQSSAKEITLHIHSPGGDVNEGFAIHDYIRSLGKPVTTIVEGLCASIATVIALSGDKRIMTANSDFMIHNPWGMIMGESSDMRKYADDLEKIEAKLSNFYGSLTNISTEEALQMMKVETTFTAEQALEKGFITEIAAVTRAVALFKHKKEDKMSKEPLNNEQVESIIDKAFNKVANFLKKEDKPKNKMVQDATGVEIDFSELEEDASPEAGDKATVDGSAAEGEYLMPNGETYVFVAGELTEIKATEEEEEGDSEEVIALKAEIEDLKSQLQNKTEEFAKKETENSELLNKVEQGESLMEEIKEEIKNIKKELGSNFEVKAPKARKELKKENEEPKRRVFKKEE